MDGRGNDEGRVDEESMRYESTRGPCDKAGRIQNVLSSPFSVGDPG